MVVRRIVREAVVGNRELQSVAEDLELREAHFLGLVRDVARLDGGAERPALHRLGQDRRRRARVAHRGVVRGVDLPVIVPAAAQVAQLLVAQVLDEGAEARVRAEEVLADVRAVGDGHALRLAVGGLAHPIHEHAVDVAREQIVPLASPDHLDHVPARPAEDGLELLDDLAVPAYRAVEPLQIAVHDEGQVVEALARRDVQRAERLGLVALAVTDEGPDA